MTTRVTRAWAKPTKRSPKFRNGMVESPWVAELDDDLVKRRVYEHWGSGRRRPTPLVVKVRGVLVEVTRDQIEEGLEERERRHQEWLERLVSPTPR